MIARGGLPIHVRSWVEESRFASFPRTLTTSRSDSFIPRTGRIPTNANRPRAGVANPARPWQHIVLLSALARNGLVERFALAIDSNRLVLLAKAKARCLNRTSRRVAWTH